jgi:putative membrane protein
MMEEAAVEEIEARSTNQLAADRTRLAARRTVMAADRSLMAWVRTALSMISFGFTIYKILQGYDNEAARLAHPDTPRHVGLFLTAMGTASMVMGTAEYWRTLEGLREFQCITIWRPSFVIALIMAAVGSFSFVSIVIRLL